MGTRVFQIRRGCGNLAALTGAVALSGCFHGIYRAAVEPIARPGEEAAASIRTWPGPVRVHLDDGSIAVFDRGIRVEPAAVVGVTPGTLYAFALTDSTAVQRIDAARVVSIQRFESERQRASGLVSVAATTAIVLVLYRGMLVGSMDSGGGFDGPVAR